MGLGCDASPTPILPAARRRTLMCVSHVRTYHRRLELPSMSAYSPYLRRLWYIWRERVEGAGVGDRGGCWEEREWEEREWEQREWEGWGRVVGGGDGHNGTSGHLKK